MARTMPAPGIDLVSIDCEVCQGRQSEPVIRLNGYWVCRCTSCRFIYVNPQPRRRRNEDAGWFNETGDASEQSAFSVLRRVYHHGLVTLERRLGRPGRLLDVGCGFGFFLKMAAERGWETAGVDVSEAGVRHARDILGLAGIERTELDGASFRRNSFDAVTLWNSLEHVPNPREVLSQSFALLAPGGVLLARVPNIQLRDVMLRAVRTVIPSYQMPEHVYLGGVTPPDHLFGFGPASLGALMRAIGLRRVVVSPSALRFDNRGGPAIELASRVLFAASLGKMNVGPTIVGVGHK